MSDPKFPNTIAEALEFILTHKFVQCTKEDLEDGFDGIEPEDLPNTSVWSSWADFVVVAIADKNVTHYQFSSYEETMFVDVTVSNGSMFKIENNKAIKVSSKVYTVRDIMDNLTETFTIITE